MDFKKILLVAVLQYGLLQSADNFVLSIIPAPRFVRYNNLLFKFNKYLHDTHDVSWQNIYPFETRMYAHWYNSANRLFFEITRDNVVIGFAWGQVLSHSSLYVRQFILNPDEYSLELLENILERLFDIMPEIQQLTVQCPSVFLEIKGMLEDFGFKQVDQDDQSVDGVFERLDWSVGS